MKRFFPQVSTRSSLPSTTGSKMKRSLSRLSRRSQLALILISLVAAATLITFVVSASRKTKSDTGVSPVNHAQDARVTKPLTRIANRRTMSPVAPFFAPTITATLADDITLGNKKDPGATITYTAIISNTGTDAFNVVYTDILDINTTASGTVKTTPIAFDDAYNVIGNVRVQPNAAAGLLVNDIDPDTGNNTGLLATAQTVSSANCAACNNVTINADGSFVYNPPVGFQGSDTFTYTVNDPTGKTGTGTVTMTVSGMVWFINNNAAACTTLTLASGCGRLTNPFSTLTAFNGVNDGLAGPPAHPKINDNIFIFESASNYIGPLTLLGGQRLFGQDSPATLQTLTGLTPQAYSDPFPAMNVGAPATTITSGSTAIFLNNTTTSNNLNGFTVGTSTTTGINGLNFGTLNVGSVILNTGSGQALVLTTGTVSIPANYAGFTSTTSTGGTNNVSLTTIAGTVNLGSGALSGAGGNGLNVNGGAAAINFSGTISNSTARQVSIINKTGGTVALSGAVSGTGTGIFLNSNTGATINFTGGISLSTGASDAFTATGGGTVNATQDNTTIVNTATTTGGAGVNMASTTIGASGITFRSISSVGGTVPGITLNTTGNTGVFAVVGNAGACTSAGTCTGGSISGKTGASETTGTPGIRLISVSNIRLTRMNISGNNHSGIYAGTVSAGGVIGPEIINGFQLETCNIENNGDAIVSNPDETGVDLYNLQGTAIGGANPTSINNTRIQNNKEIELLITNISGTLTDFQMNNDTLSSNNNDVANPHSDLVTFLNRSTTGASMTLNVVGGSFTGFTGNNNPSQLGTVANGIFADTSGSGGTPNSMTANVSGGTYDHLNVGVGVSTAGTNGNLTFDINGATVTQSRSHALNLFVASDTTGTVNGKFRNNIVGALGTASSGSDVGFGIRVQNEALSLVNPVNVTISGNTVQEFKSTSAINVNHGLNTNPSSKTTNVTITGNTIRNITSGVGTGNLRAIIIQQNNTTAPGIVCANISGNTLTNIEGNTGDATRIRLRQLAGGTFNVTQTDVNNLAAVNGSTAAQMSLSGTITFNQPACLQPPIANPDDGGLATNAPIGPVNGDSAEQTQVSTTLTSGGSSASPSAFAWLKQIQNPVAAFATKLNFLRNGEVPVIPALTASEKSALIAEVKGISAPQKPDDQKVSPQSGETITVNGSGGGFTLPAGKTITITYDATVNAPPFAPQVSTQGKVSGSNFVLVNGITTAAPNTDDPETGGPPDATKTNINVTSTWTGATSTDWNTASNWNPSTYAPGVSNPAVNDVVIPNAATFQPNISATDIGILSLNISNGRTLTITNPRTLTIGGAPGGNLTLDGIISGGGFLNLGTGAHAINNAGGTGSIGSTILTTVLSGSTVTLNNNLQMGSLQVNSGGSMTITGNTLSLNGGGAALVVQGGATFTPAVNGDGASPVTSPGGEIQAVNSTVVYNGSVAQTGAGIPYGNLTINNAAGVTLTGDASLAATGQLTLTSGDLNMGNTGQFTLTVPNTLATLPANGTFDVVGSFKRTGAPLASATALTFGNSNNIITLTGSTLTSLTVQLTKTTPSGTFSGNNIGWPGSIQRYYLITPAGGAFTTSTLRLHYLDSELNAGVNPANVEGSLRLYKYVIASPSTGWQQQDPSGAVTTFDSANNWVQKTAVTSFSPWTIAGASPTATTSTVSGRILDNDGNPVEGAVIRLNGTQDRKTITDSHGNYSFSEVETNGFYTVTPSRVNYNFAPAIRGFSALGAHTEASFGATTNGNHLNPLDTTEYFVRQQYVDFLGREPEEKALNDWTDTINNCASGDASCDRVHVSEAFFRSEEFQQRGYFVYRFYSTAFGQKPDYTAFVPDLSRVSGFLDATQLEAAKIQFANDFTSRAAFVNQYGQMTNAQYVDALAQTAGVTLSNRQALVDSLAAGTMTRAQALRQIAESGEVYARYYNQAFVVMEYFGYLRRDPDSLYLNWISVLDANPADSRHMVEGFVDATEYRNRFPR